MTESQREAVPRDDDGELDTALAFLRFARGCLLKKLDGLDDDQLRRRLVASGTNLLGLVQHSAVGERWWFAHHVLGRFDEDDVDFGMDTGDRTTEDVLADYRAAIAESDEVVLAAAEGLETLTARGVDGRPKTLRWVVAHMTSETARHAGHADVLRELIDGTTGR